MSPRSASLKCLTVSFFAIAFLLPFLLPLSALAEEGIPTEIIAVHPENFPPYYSTDANGQSSGFAIDVFNAVAQRAGLKVRYRPVNAWEDVSEAMENGSAHVIPNHGNIAKRRDKLLFTAPMDTFNISLFSRHEDTHFISIEDIGRRKTAVVKTNAAHEILGRRGDLRLIVFATLDDAFAALLEGKVDALVYPERVAWVHARQHGFSDRIRHFGVPLKEIKRAIAVRKDLPELHKVLDKALQEFQDTKEFDALYRKWLILPTEPKSYLPENPWLLFALGIAVVLAGLLYINNHRSHRFIDTTLELNKDGRRRILTLVFVMATVAVSVASIVLSLLYQAAFVETEKRLVESAKSHARLIESIARFDKQHAEGLSADPTEATFSQIKGGLTAFSGSVELTIARRRNDSIEFILRQKASLKYEPGNIPLNSPIAEPMRRALSGQSGTMVGLDYRNIEVLAAHEPVDIIGLGVVIKMDMAEIRKPFIKAGLSAAGFAIIVTIMGVMVFVYVSNPMLRRIVDSEARLRSILDSIPISLTATQLSDGTFTYVNPAAADMVGSTAGGLLGHSAKDLYADIDDRVRLVSALEEYGEVRDYELELKRTDGTVFWVSMNGVLSTYMGQKAILACWQDISARKQAESAFHSEEEKSERYLAVAGVMFVALDAAGNIQLVNPKGCEVLGRAEHELIGKNWFETCLPEEVRGDVQAVFAQLIKGKIEPVEYFENEIIVKGGGTRRIAWHNSILCDEDGFATGILSSGEDITDRVQAKKALQENLHFIEQIISQSPVGIATYDSDGQCTSANESIAAIVGATKKQVLAQNYNEIESWKKSGLLDAVKEAAEQQTPKRHDVRAMSTFGQEIALDCSIAPFTLKGKGHILLVTNDISEQLQMETALRQAHKMHAVGQLTGGIAHDFNNMLGVIMGNLELLGRIVADNEKASERVEMALNGAARAATLTKKLLLFSRDQASDTHRTDINKTLLDMHDLIEKSLTASIKITNDLADDLWPVAIDQSDFENSILNLAVNARDAMPHGGMLTIETSNKVLDDYYCRRNQSCSPGDFIMISLSDTGEGMTEDVAQKAVDPFFSTKEIDQGTGLGLSMVYGFVQRSGGHLGIYSEPGKGSTVRMYLPRAIEAEEKSPNKPAIANTLPLGTETILVVDDEKDLADVAVTYLEKLGYKTLTAHNGAEALDILKEHPDIDLVFSDVIMPGDLDGYHLAFATRKIRPLIKVLLTSGFTRKGQKFLDKDAKFATRLSRSLLSKPYNQSELAIAIRRTLDEGEKT